MLTRTRELLMRWGHFSSSYTRKARLGEAMTPREIAIAMCRLLALTVLPVGTISSLAALPLTEPSIDASGQYVLWGTVVGLFGNSFPLFTVKWELTDIPFGSHDVLNFTFSMIVYALTTYAIALAFGVIPVPFDVVVVPFASLVVMEIMYRPKIIPMTHAITGAVKRVSVGSMLQLPSTLRFDGGTRHALRRALKVLHILLFYCILYVALLAIFSQSGVLLQCVLTIIFIMTRISFEFMTDRVISPVHGSDRMLAIAFASTMMKEVVVAMMLANAHPLIFAVLIVADIFENVYCLWCIAQSIRKGQKVVPSSAADLPDTMESKKKSYKDASPLKKQRKKTYLGAQGHRRSVGIGHLARQLSRTPSQTKAFQISQYIVAILLQREFVEVLVPLQAFAIVSMLGVYDSGFDTTIVGLDDDGLRRFKILLLIDVAVEFLMFALTVLALWKLFPTISGLRILSRVQSMHFYSMVSFGITFWAGVYRLQHVLSGTDLSFSFEWMRCANATWTGSGYHWGTDLGNGTIGECVVT